MKIGTWLLTLVEPIIAKILIALGFSVVSIVGMDAVIVALKNQVVTEIGSLPNVMLQFALYLYVGKGLGILFGAMTTKLMLWSIQNATKIVGRTNG